MVSGLVIGLIISILVNVIIVPIVLWLSWDGIKFRIWRFKARNPKFEAQLFFTKNNTVLPLLIKKDEHRVRIFNGTYVSTPVPDKVFKFLGYPVRLRRENIPEDFDPWERPIYDYELTAKELDNVINEAQDSGLLAWIKKNGTLILIVLLAFAALGFIGLFLNYKVYDALKTIAPTLLELFPGGMTG